MITRKGAFAVKQNGFLFAIVALSALGVAGANADELRERQTQACMNDAMRLCSAYIPDETRISACMEAKRADLTPGCRAFFTATSASAEDTRPAGMTRMKAREAYPVSVR